MEIRGGKRFRTKQERRQIVEETLKPGASVSVVARAHDVNANQVFYWRRLYREGWFDEVEQRATSAGTGEDFCHAGAEDNAASVEKAGHNHTGTIDIDLGHARVRIEGAADPDCVHAAVEGLLR